MKDILALLLVFLILPAIAGAIEELPPPDCIEGLPEAGGNCPDDVIDSGDINPMPPLAECLDETTGRYVVCPPVVSEAGGTMSVLYDSYTGRRYSATTLQTWYDDAVSSFERCKANYEASWEHRAWEQRSYGLGN